jgi:hypothetical protein
MSFLRKIYSHPNFWPILIILVFSLLAGRELFLPGYFNMHDDLQMMRQLEMEKCFLDGQIPCRWVPDMGYGFGFPLFNYYPPLPYLVGEGIRLLGLSFVTTVKVVFVISFLASGITMYLLAKEFFGKFGGVVSSIFYIWAPYHAVDVYVRGAMNEAWGLIWFPAILWTSYRLIKEKKKTLWVIGLALAWFGLLTSHNLMVLIFTPIFGLWCFLFMWLEKKWKIIPQFVISGVLALGLAAFFTLPAILEQKYVQVNTLVTGYYEYIAHFASLNQLLFSRFWGYGPSVWETGDGMPFQIGHIHWILSLVVGVVVLAKIFKGNKKISAIPSSLFVVLFFLAIGWFAAFMAHSRSTPIWQAIAPLAFVQFPWRFLTMVTLAFSFIAGSVVLFVPKKFAVVIPLVLLLGLVLFNWDYFRPEKMGPLTDEEKFSAAAWELQQTAGIYDYLPVDAREAPKGPRKKVAEIMTGKGEIKDEKSGTNWAAFNSKIDSETATVRVNIFKYPLWQIVVDGKDISLFVPETEKWGRMYIDLPEGTHEIYVRLYNTLPRTVGNLISLVSWIGLIGFVIVKRLRAASSH